MSVMESVQKAKDNYKSLLDKAKELDESEKKALYSELTGIVSAYVSVDALSDHGLGDGAEGVSAPVSCIGRP